MNVTWPLHTKKRGFIRDRLSIRLGLVFANVAAHSFGVNSLAKIWSLLTPGERRRAGKLAVLMICSMGMETVGIGLVIPVVTLLSQSGVALKHPLANWLLAQLGHPDPGTLVVGMMAALVGLYSVKSLFLAFVAWRQVGFAYGVQAQLSQRLFDLYLRQPYAFMLQRNSAQLLRNLTSEINLFAVYGLTPCLNILAESLVLIGLGALLLWVEPVGALIVAAVMGGVGWLFHHLIKVRVIRWGEARQMHEGFRIQHAQQGLGGAKEIKLFAREAEFLAEYHAHNSASARMAQREQTLGQMPRLGLEFLAVCALAALVLLLLARGQDAASVIAKIGLFAAAAFRLLPSATKVFGALQSLKYSRPVVDSLHAEFTLQPPVAFVDGGAIRPFAGTLELRDVSFAYPGRAEPALAGISLAIQRGESIGFIGTSGAGKSTLVDVLLGLMEPASGRILVDGRDLHTNSANWQRQIGYVPQTIFLTDDTLRRNVAFGVPATAIDDAAVWRAIRAAQLEEFVKGLPDGLETTVGERGVRLSGGQRQRIGLARALYREPAVLVLDEATAALDTATEKSLMEAVSALHGAKTLLIVAHRLSTVEKCDRLYRLDNGRIREQGTYAEIFQTRA